MIQRFLEYFFMNFISEIFSDGHKLPDGEGKGIKSEIEKEAQYKNKKRDIGDKIFVMQ